MGRRSRRFVFQKKLVKIQTLPIMKPTPNKELVVYMCKSCNLYFPLKHMLENHDESYHKNQKDIAPLNEGCGIFYAGYQKLKSETYVCSYCTFESTTFESVVTHCKTKHPTLIHAKQETSSQIPAETQDFWPMDTLEDSETKTRICPYCLFETNNCSTFHSHVKRKHRDKWLESIAKKVAALQPTQHECSHCQFVCGSQAELDDHVFQEHDFTEKFDESIEEVTVEETTTKVEETPTRKCPHCPFESSVASTLHSHIARRHRNQRRTREPQMTGKRQPNAQQYTGYACHYCTFVAATIASINAHTAKEHSTEKQPIKEVPVTEYDCDQCDYKCKNRKNMQSHLKRCHTTLANAEGMFTCHICSYETLSKMGLQRHISIKHNKPRREAPNRESCYECEQCDFKSLNRKMMDWHKRQHSAKPNQEDDGNSYFCNDCDFSTWTKGQLFQHIRRKHKDADGNDKEPETEQIEHLYACDQCDYTSKNKHVMKVHVIRKHTSEYNHECDICGKKYKIKADLTNHVRFQHREQPIICDVCGKTCRNSNLLYLHQKFAHYKPEFECPICHRRMVSQANLDEHILKQHEQREDAVCEECGKTFTRQARLKIHMRIHTGVKPYTCKVCLKSFARRNGLRQHLLIHTGQRPYICDICGKSFTQKTGLISHRKSHPGSHPPLPRVTIDHVLSDLLNDET